MAVVHRSTDELDREVWKKNLSWLTYYSTRRGEKKKKKSETRN
jgi:hypothetical protein